MYFQGKAYIASSYLSPFSRHPSAKTYGSQRKMKIEIAPKKLTICNQTIGQAICLLLEESLWENGMVKDDEKLHLYGT